jgi:hypothetical protein
MFGPTVVPLECSVYKRTNLAYHLGLGMVNPWANHFSSFWIEFMQHPK